MDPDVRPHATTLDLGHLESVIRADRRRVDAVFDEVARDTAAGCVDHDLAVDVIASVRTHLDVLDDVLGAVDGARCDSSRHVREALMLYEASLEPGELDRLRRSWARDRVAVDASITRAREVHGERFVARLGGDFVDGLEIRRGRRPRASTARSR
jgi:hypothetical protein